MSKQFYIATLGFLLLCFFAKAQNDTLWLMNGKKVVVHNYQLLNDTDDPLIQTISYELVNGKKKTIYTDEVFSVLKKDKSESVFYKPQPEIGETLQVAEMKQFVTGLNDAENDKVNDLLLAGGFAAGLIGALTPQVHIGSGQSGGSIPLGILVPISYVSITGYFIPGKKYLNAASLPKQNDFYEMGLSEGYKRKSIKKNVLATCIGFFSGMLMVNAMNAY
jgi:hypothetical protein